MLLDLCNFFSQRSKDIETKVMIDFSQEDFNGYAVKSPLECYVKLENSNNNAKLDISFIATVLSCCARCLDDIEENFAVERTFLIKYNEWTFDDPNGNNLPFNENGKLDLKELVYCEIMLCVPSVMLCKLDCKGLCPVCGKHKEKECNCTIETEVDERLLPLKKLLTNEST